MTTASCYYIKYMNAAVADATKEFFGKYRVRKYAKGQILILNGDNPEAVYYLLSGRVKQYDVTYRGDEIILNVYKPPAFFPMSLVINKMPNLYTYEAETDVELRQAPTVDVVAFLKANPDVTFDLLSRVYSGLEGLLGRMAHLMASSANERLMFELSHACRRFGEKTEVGGCRLKMNESELAARAGMSRETVNREMKKLMQSGLITYQGGIMTIVDIKVFEEKINRSL